MTEDVRLIDYFLHNMTLHIRDHMIQITPYSSVQTTF